MEDSFRIADSAVSIVSRRYVSPASTALIARRLSALSSITRTVLAPERGAGADFGAEDSKRRPKVISKLRIMIASQLRGSGCQFESTAYETFPLSRCSSRGCAPSIGCFGYAWITIASHG